MARDLRVIGANRNNYPDRCYYYDKSIMNGNVMVKDPQPLGRFYKRDLVSFQWERVDLGGGVFSTELQFVGTVESKDHLEDLRIGMYVKDNTGMWFRVSSPLVSDDANESKAVGTRPTFTYQFKLVGIEKRK